MGFICRAYHFWVSGFERSSQDELVWRGPAAFTRRLVVLEVAANWRKWQTVDAPENMAVANKIWRQPDTASSRLAHQTSNQPHGYTPFHGTLIPCLLFRGRKECDSTGPRSIMPLPTPPSPTAWPGTRFRQHPLRLQEINASGTPSIGKVAFLWRWRVGPCLSI